VNIEKRLILLVVILLVFISLNILPCAFINSDIVEILNNIKNSNIKNVLIIYKTDLCANCSSGKFLYSKNIDKEVLTIFKNTFSREDILNINKIFSLNNEYIIGDETSDRFVNKLKRCKKIREENIIYYITINENRKIKRIEYVT